MSEDSGASTDRVKTLAAEARALRRGSPVVTLPEPDRPAVQAGEAGQLAADLLATQERLAERSAAFDELREAYQRLAAQRDRVEEETESRYRQRLNVADSRDVIQTRRIEQLVMARDRLLTRVEGLETDGKAAKARRDVLARRVSALEAEVAMMTRQREAMQARIKALGEGNRASAARIEVLKKRIEILGVAGKQPAPAPAPEGPPPEALELLEHELDLARLEAEDLLARLHAAEQANAAMVSSRSWQVTRPLRGLMAVLARVRG